MSNNAPEAVASNDQLGCTSPTKAPAKQLGCDYFAPTFGGNYPDGQCVDGYLMDMDDDGIGDDPPPCPYCNAMEAVRRSGLQKIGNAHQRRIRMRAAAKRLQAWALERSANKP